PQSIEDAVADDAGKKTIEEPTNEGEGNCQEKEGGALNKEDDQNVQDFRAELDNLLVQQKEGYATSTNKVSTVSPSVSVDGKSFDNVDDLLTDPLMYDLEDTADLLNTGIFSGAYDDEDVGAEADLNNLETTMNIGKSILNMWYQSELLLISRIRTSKKKKVVEYHDTRSSMSRISNNRLWVKVLTALWLLMVVKSLVFKEYVSNEHDMVMYLEVVISAAKSLQLLDVIFKDMLKNFDRDDLVKLWSLVHERFNSTKPTEDKERELWVELKRLFELDDDDTLWTLQRYMHDPLKWRLYDTCVVHHVSMKRGHDIFMLVEKDYPLTRELMTLMMRNKLQVVESLVMVDELLGLLI
ncbi:hypothetical protein Tco_1257432, partial [Tanacetum coccineum]